MFIDAFTVILTVTEFYATWQAGYKHYIALSAHSTYSGGRARLRRGFIGAPAHLPGFPVHPKV